MRIFVTGAAGFIGRAVVDKARSDGHEVLCLSRPWHMAKLPIEELRRFRPEGVIHCAWVTTPGVYLESSDNLLHRRWSMEMVKELLNVGARRFTVLGTCAEYAPSNQDLCEDLSITAPVSLYGKEKHRLHSELMEMSQRLGIELVWLRLFYPYGPTEDPRRLITSLIRGFRSGNALRLMNSQAERDYVHVSDVASAIVRCASGAFEGTFNIGTGKGIVLADLERLVRYYATGEDLGVEMSEVNLPSERVVADASKLRSIGWKPEFDIRSGIQTYFKGPIANFWR